MYMLFQLYFASFAQFVAALSANSMMASILFSTFFSVLFPRAWPQVCERKLTYSCLSSVCHHLQRSRAARDAAPVFLARLDVQAHTVHL